MKHSSSLNITLNDFKFVPAEMVFLEAYVWALYNIFTRPLAQRIREFCAEISHHPSIRVRYVVVAGRERVSETYNLVTDIGSSFLSIDISQATKPCAEPNVTTHLRSSELAETFDNFMVNNATASFKTGNRAVHVDIQTVNYLLRPLLMTLPDVHARGRIEVDDDCFTLYLEHQVDGSNTCVTLKFYNTNVKGKAS